MKSLVKHQKFDSVQFTYDKVCIDKIEKSDNLGSRKIFCTLNTQPATMPDNRKEQGVWFTTDTPRLG